ncbi:hypothetical protein IFM58399_10125 [Aspergillus lentulus]|uniref:uncharacterized protein n=1 Tax=Aspergillus lentulus TaxID=293939 RepID=UPI0013952075|nr:uncharacterized protein IFM58399_10125 [Aspergillus lentulus]GFF55649.1 hypothetical protein IFM58399_10125 [Aspergillus lentulus]GFF80067.1 hypothetical protein IFM62136_10217 [Aspergillus lentulus]
MAESTAPVPDPEPTSMSEPMPEAVFEPAPELAPEPDPIPKPVPDPVFEAAPQSATQSDPEPDSYLNLEEMDKAAKESTIKQHKVNNTLATRATKATKPASKRAEITTKAPAILPKPIIIEYTQPNTSKKHYTIPENLLSKAATLPYS